MQSNQVHVCLETPEAPTHGAVFADGTRWVCQCGANYVYRQGFNRAGFAEMDWWPAPAVAVPQQRKGHRSLRDRLTHAREG